MLDQDDTVSVFSPH